MCDRPQPTDEVTTCDNGCAFEGEVAFSWPIYVPAPEPLWYLDPSVLCAGAPAPMLGDACDLATGSICLPTFAALASDGTVAGQTYLFCNVDTRLCEEHAPPVVRNYLERCTDTRIAEYGGTDVSGAVPVRDDRGDVCLLAWDSNAMMTRSGVSAPCLGDWMCPSGALCDDQILDLVAGGGATVPVCKPGPRGVLDPGILSP